VGETVPLPASVREFQGRSVAPLGETNFPLPPLAREVTPIPAVTFQASCCKRLSLLADVADRRHTARPCVFNRLRLKRAESSVLGGQLDLDSETMSVDYCPEAGPGWRSAHCARPVDVPQSMQATEQPSLSRRLNLACARNLTRAEEHHRTAIHQADSAHIGWRS